MNYTTPGLAQRTMGASLASESRLSRFGGPARRVVSMPDEDESGEEVKDEVSNVPMSPISGERNNLKSLTSDAPEEHPLRHAHASVSEEQQAVSSPLRVHDHDLAATSAPSPRSPPSCKPADASPPPLTDSGRDNWLASHPKADTAKRKVDDQEPWTHAQPPPATTGHAAEARPLRASRPAPVVSSVRAQEQLLPQHPPTQSPQLLQQNWGHTHQETAAKTQPPAPPQAVPKRSFLVRLVTRVVC